jgi:hypothetical protein
MFEEKREAIMAIEAALHRLMSVVRGNSEVGG